MFRQLGQIRALISEGADPNAKNDHGNTPLHEAAESDVPEMAEVLIAAGADVNARDNSGNTPLHEAAMSDRLETVKALIRAGADPNAKANLEQTPLHKAAAFGGPEMVKALISAGADPNAKMLTMDYTPLHEAASGETVKSLIAAGADPDARGSLNASGRTPLHHAVQTGDRGYRSADTANALIVAGADVNARDNDDNTPLLFAALWDNIEAVQDLTFAGADVDAQDDKGDTALLVAASRSNLGIVQVLLSAGADPNLANNVRQSPLHLAATHGPSESVRALVSAGADIEARALQSGLTPLFMAAVSNALVVDGLGVVKELLSSGADPNARGTNGVPILHHLPSSYEGQVNFLDDVVDTLVTAGADVDAVARGVTALQLAVSADDLPLVLGLIRAGADPNLKDEGGNTPLHDAAMKGNHEVVEALLSAGADPNLKDSQGQRPADVAESDDVRRILRTSRRPGTAAGDGRGTSRPPKTVFPLIEAVITRNQDRVAALISSGEDVDERDNGGATALHLAAMVDNLEAMRALISAGADLNAQDRSGNSPLHLAAVSDTRKGVLQLLEAGAEPDLKNDRGQRPKDVAETDDIRRAFRWFRDNQSIPTTSPQPTDRAGPQPAPEILNWPTPPTAPVGQKPGIPFIPFGKKKEEQMTTMSMIGAPAAGKTHVAALLYTHLRSHPEIDIDVTSFSDHEHNVMRSAGDLAWGIPLEPTPREVLASSELRVTFQEDVRSRFRPTRREERQILIPIMDSAGELLNAAMTVLLEARGGIAPAVLAERLRELNFEARFVNDLFNHVFRSDAFCFVLDAGRLVGGKDRSREFEHVTFLDNLRKFRRAQNLPKIRNAMLVLTKYDEIKTSLDDAVLTGMYGGGLHNRDVLAHYLCPALKSNLDGAVKEGGGNPVKVVLSSTEWAQRKMSDEEIDERYGKGISDEKREEYAAGRFEYKVLPNGTRVPDYDEAEYEEIVNWLKSL